MDDHTLLELSTTHSIATYIHFLFFFEKRCINTDGNQAIIQKEIIVYDREKDNKKQVIYEQSLVWRINSQNKDPSLRSIKKK